MSKRLPQNIAKERAGGKDFDNRVVRMEAQGPGNVSSCQAEPDCFGSMASSFVRSAEEDQSFPTRF